MASDKGAKAWLLSRRAFDLSSYDDVLVVLDVTIVDVTKLWTML